MCPKSFSQESDQKIHYNIHTGKKPYTCNFCKKAYTAPSTLQKHMKSKDHKFK